MRYEIYDIIYKINLTKTEKDKSIAKIFLPYLENRIETLK